MLSSFWWRCYPSHVIFDSVLAVRGILLRQPPERPPVLPPGDLRAGAVLRPCHADELQSGQRFKFFLSEPYDLLRNRTKVHERRYPNHDRRHEGR